MDDRWRPGPARAGPGWPPLLLVFGAERRGRVIRGRRVAGDGTQRVDAAVAEALVVAGQADVDRRPLEQGLDLRRRELHVAIGSGGAELADDEGRDAGGVRRCHAGALDAAVAAAGERREDRRAAVASRAGTAGSGDVDLAGAVVRIAGLLRVGTQRGGPDDAL